MLLPHLYDDIDQDLPDEFPPEDGDEDLGWTWLHELSGPFLERLIALRDSQLASQRDGQSDS